MPSSPLYCFEPNTRPENDSFSIFLDERKKKFEKKFHRVKFSKHFCTDFKQSIALFFLGFVVLILFGFGSKKPLIFVCFCGPTVVHSKMLLNPKICLGVQLLDLQ